MIEVIGYFASFCVGLTLGLIGGGGSALCIPILVYLFSIEIVEATAYSLFIVGISSVAGALQRVRNLLIDFNVGLIFGVPSILSKFLARKWVVPLIPDIVLQTEHFVLTKRLFILGFFSILVILAAAAMILKRTPINAYSGKGARIWLIIQGAFIGLITGVTGLGGGFLIMPTLLFFANMPFKKAVGTSLMIIAMSSLIGFTGDLSHTHIHWIFLSQITCISVLGIFAGNLLSKRMSGDHLKTTLGWFILIMGLFTLIKELLA